MRALGGCKLQKRQAPKNLQKRPFPDTIRVKAREVEEEEEVGE